MLYKLLKLYVIGERVTDKLSSISFTLWSLCIIFRSHTRYDRHKTTAPMNVNSIPICKFVDQIPVQIVRFPIGSVPKPCIVPAPRSNYRTLPVTIRVTWPKQKRIASKFPWPLDLWMCNFFKINVIICACFRNIIHPTAYHHLYSTWVSYFGIGDQSLPLRSWFMACWLWRHIPIVMSLTVPSSCVVTQTPMGMNSGTRRWKRKLSLIFVKLWSW